MAMSEKVAPVASRSMWKGSVSFGLVSVGVSVYAATQDNDVSFKQIHVHDDGGVALVKQKRVCSGCDTEVAFADIGKGVDMGDRILPLSKEDLAGVALESMRTIAVQEFVPLASVDPIMHERTYFLAPQDKTHSKAYALLRDALTDTGRAGVVKVALRQREQVGLLHVRPDGCGGTVLALTTLRWADEVRHAAMPILSKLPGSEPAELAMAKMLVESLAAEAFVPDGYEDGYRHALQAVIDAKMAGQSPVPAMPTESNVLDLMSALRASVERAQQERAA